MANTLGYFNLQNDGDSAVVRLLHSSPDTIEKAMVHNIVIDGKRRSIKCCGENCPLCREKPTERIYIHLIDFTDQQEKVWNRTPTIIKQLVELYQSWGNLSNLVLKITRRGKDFPKYDVMVLPSQGLPPLPSELLDAKIAYRCYLYRSIDEIRQFLQTGVMPPHTKAQQAVPKSEYFANNGNGNSAQASSPYSYVPNTNAQATVTVASTVPQTPNYNYVPQSANAPRQSSVDMYADPFAPPIRR